MICGENISTLTSVGFDSTGHSNPHHLHPIVLPRCRTARRLQRQASQRPSHLYDPRGFDDRHCERGADGVASGLGLWGILEFEQGEADDAWGERGRGGWEEWGAADRDWRRLNARDA